MSDKPPSSTGDASATEDLVRALIARRSESKSLDYKGAMAFAGKKGRGEIVKCLMAMANSVDGGFILVGVDDKTKEIDGLTADQAATFDVSAMGDFARRYCSELPDFGSATVEVDRQILVLLAVRSFRREPVVCTSDLHDEKGKRVLRAGTVYVRTDDAKCEAVGTAQDMRELVRVAVARNEGDLLARIQALVGVHPQQPASTPEPYAQEIQSSLDFFDEQGIQGSYWQVIVRPAKYEARRLTLAQVRQARRDATVSLRGWDFPHVDRENDHPVFGGVQSVTEWGRYHEAHRSFRSGAFVWRRRISEDLANERDDDGRPVLRLLSALFNTTEFGLFAARWIHDIEVPPDEQAVVEVRVEGLQGRTVVGDSDVIFFPRTTQADHYEAAASTSAIELENGWKELSIQWATDLFELFDAELPRAFVASWQERLLNRQL